MSVTEAVLYESVVFGSILVVGGVVGYVKSKSRPSLFMGCGSGVLALLFANYGLKGHDLIALFLLACEAVLLSAVFYTRFQKTKKFMPAGFLLVLSVVSLVLYVTGILVA